MTRRDRTFAGTVKDTISSSFNAAKPNASAARAPSIAYPLSPVFACETPSDLDAWRERRRETRHGEPDVSGEGSGTTDLNRPESPPVRVDVRRNSLGERVAVVAGKDRREEFHDAWIGVERREWLEIVPPPGPQEQPLGGQLHLVRSLKSADRYHRDGCRVT